jgi:hypothetical protein
VFCIVVLVWMLVLPFWAPRAFKPTYEKALKLPRGRRLLAWIIIAFEALLLGGIVNVVDAGFWPTHEEPLLLPGLSCVLLVGGTIGALWAGYKLLELQKFG